MKFSRVNRRRRASALAAAGVIAVVLSGCQSAVDVGEVDETAEPSVGGIMTLAQSTDIQPANLQAARAGNDSWSSNVFETLVVFNDQMEPQPLLASEWTLADDGLSMNIVLRDDVTFHGGRAMTADDVKFSFEQVIDTVSQVAYIARSFESIEVASDTELTINFTQRTPNIFDFFHQTYIIDSESVMGLEDGSQVIGTGPFLFDSWSPGSSVTLTRNDDYWGGPSYLDGIEIAVITDSTAIVNAVRGGRSQVAIGMNPIDVQTLATNAQFTVVDTSGEVYPLGIDTSQAPFDSKEARQAVNFAIDRERIASQIFGDAGIVTELFWDPGTPGYPADLVGTYAYDPDRARELLEEAGASGASVTITVINLPANASVAEIVRNNLEEVGLVPSINLLEVQSFGPQQIEGDLGQMFMPLHPLNGFGPVTLMNTFPSLREGNSSKFWTDEYVQLRTNLVAAEDDATYEEALRELTEYILEEAFTSNIVMAAAQTVIADGLSDLQVDQLGRIVAHGAFVSE